jgi:hypothetical protein
LANLTFSFVYFQSAIPLKQMRGHASDIPMDEILGPTADLHVSPPPAVASDYLIRRAMAAADETIVSGSASSSGSGECSGHMFFRVVEDNPNGIAKNDFASTEIVVKFLVFVGADLDSNSFLVADEQITKTHVMTKANLTETLANACTWTRQSGDNYTILDIDISCKLKLCRALTAMQRAGGWTISL